jgi:hypothetical protein
MQKSTVFMGRPVKELLTTHLAGNDGNPPSIRQLDDQAARFIASGWSHLSLHRKITLSAAS